MFTQTRKTAQPSKVKHKNTVKQQVKHKKQKRNKNKKNKTKL